ncbi:hypothetical protein ACFWZ6_08510 [Streptomyces massasporeus]
MDGGDVARVGWCGGVRMGARSGGDSARIRRGPRRLRASGRLVERKQEAVMACMPTEDVEFHDAIKEVFRRYPEAQGKYALASLDLENEMKINFDEKVGVSRIEGDKIITEFKDRESVIRMQICLKWNFDYTECLHWRDVEE